MNDPYGQLSVATGVTDGTNNKPEVYFEGDPRFWFWFGGIDEVASLDLVLNHPKLGLCVNVRTSRVLRKFEGGFETQNTIYIQATPEIRAMFKPNIGG